jgi:hypothetical protein
MPRLTVDACVVQLKKQPMVISFDMPWCETAKVPFRRLPVRAIIALENDPLVLAVAAEAKQLHVLQVKVHGYFGTLLRADGKSASVPSANPNLRPVHTLTVPLHGHSYPRRVPKEDLHKQLMYTGQSHS